MLQMVVDQYLLHLIKTIDLTIDLVNGTNINGNRIDIDNPYSYFNKKNSMY